jgi:transcriptional regulator with XRE-family HTH domain
MINDNTIDYQKLGRRIKIIRIEKDMSQEEFAEKADISVNFLSHVENAHSKPSLSTFVKISNALEVATDDLLCDSLKVGRYTLDNQLASVVSDCSDDELRLIIGIAKAAKETSREVADYNKRLIRRGD